MGLRFAQPVFDSRAFTLTVEMLSLLSTNLTSCMMDKELHCGFIKPKAFPPLDLKGSSALRRYVFFNLSLFLKLLSAEA